MACVSKTKELEYKKENLEIFCSHFCIKSRLTLSPFQIFAALFTYLGKVVASQHLKKLQYLFVNQKNKNFSFKRDNFWLTRYSLVLLIYIS